MTGKGTLRFWGLILDGQRKITDWILNTPQKPHDTEEEE
jgi:hypothetical protein